MELVITILIVLVFTFFYFFKEIVKTISKTEDEFGKESYENNKGYEK